MKPVRGVPLTGMALTPHPHHLGALWIQGPSNTTPSFPCDQGRMRCPGLSVTEAVVVLIVTQQVSYPKPETKASEIWGSR